MRAGAERAEVTVEQVVRELKLLGFSDIRKVVSWRNELVTRTEKGEDGEPVLMPRVTIIDADKISDEAAAAVAEVSQTVNEPVSWARTSVAANRATAANALIVVFMAFSLFRMLDLRIGLPRP